ncbi:MAG: undecaprenyldiphospho-muramoylpentapeptide beta-N-acetylglucosaminyltransferase [Candidatus Omnitrophica bacterium]|nr:undecaprenyldiphospho-muramoylpentapeptide beta-N-acetylglucosaminyltransferase [Candidatus Omnitrophota bacterium]
MRVMIVAGGTGGHLFPAIRLAEEIHNLSSDKILFITSSRRQDRDILKERHIPFRVLPVIGFQSRNAVHILNFAVRLIGSLIKSLFLVLQFRPTLVIGFGGYVSGPIVITSVLLRIKTIVHEQNVYPGKTNRILAGFVDKIAISFPETLKYLDKFKSKIIITGNLLRKGLREVQKKEGAGFTVLAMGGSQGSHILNKLIPEAVSLMESCMKDTLGILHISGYEEEEEVIKAYRDRSIKSRVFSFTGEMNKLYNECDFVISRAGALTVSELLYLAKPSILIPYPHASGHQRLNAKLLEDRGGALLLEEKDLKAEDLRDAMVRLMDRDLLSDMSNKVKYSGNRDACDILMDEIRDLVGAG